MFLQTQESKHKDTDEYYQLSWIYLVLDIVPCCLICLEYILRAAEIQIMKPSLSNREGCKIVPCSSCHKLRVSVIGTFEQNKILVRSSTDSVSVLLLKQVTTGISVLP